MFAIASTFNNSLLVIYFGDSVVHVLVAPTTAPNQLVLKEHCAI